MSNKYLITGATGFIGANITRDLVKKGENVSLIVRDRNLNWRLKDIASQMNIYECNILDSHLEAIIKKIKPSYIFHFAGYGVYSGEKDWDTLVDVNIKGTMNLLTAVKALDFKLFINAGSCSEYGMKDMPMKESDPLEPFSDYGVTKSAATLLCQKEAFINNLPIITFRLFTAYGYYEDQNRLVPSVILPALRNKHMKLSFSYNTRNFTFIEDIVDAYSCAIKTKFNPGEIFNIASKQPHTVGDVARTVLKITKSNSKIKWLGKKKEHWDIEPFQWEVDIAKANKIFGWEPKNDLQTGLKKTIEWYKKFSSFYL